MPFSPFEAMRKAIEAARESAHPVNKIGAALAGYDIDGQPYLIARANHTPAPISAALGPSVRIGDTSNTVHAETAAILAAPITSGASLYVTDPLCPNCAMLAAESGVASVFIDSEGFQGEWASRRREDFNRLSLPVFRQAGIAVYSIDGREGTLTPLIEDALRPHAVEHFPVLIEPLRTRRDYEALNVLVARHRGKDSPFAAAIAHDASDERFGMVATAQPSMGYVFNSATGAVTPDRRKYSLTLNPLDRLLMNAGRYGLRIRDGLIYTSHIPTAREQVHILGAGLQIVAIGNALHPADTGRMAAWGLLTSAGVLQPCAADGQAPCLR